MKFNNCINKIKTFVPRSINTTPIKVVSHAALVASLVLMGTSAFAGPREQAKRMHDRLAGVPPTDNVLCIMSELITAGRSTDAAHVVMSIDVPADVTAGRIDSAALTAAEGTCGALDNSASRKAFYSISLRDFATPMTNRLQTRHGDLNDYVTMVIGMIRDGEPYNTVLSTGKYWDGAGGLGVSARSDENNNHFRELGDGGFDLSDANVLVQRATRGFSASVGAPDNEAAGIATTRAAGFSFFSKGTNRRMFRFTAMNFLCRDLEQLKDPTRSHDRVRQDASRSPGGDSTIFFTNCVACHAGMDGMAESYAYWEWLAVDANDDGNPDENAGRLLYKQNYDPVTLNVSSAVDMTDNCPGPYCDGFPDNPNGVANKYHINDGNFMPGFRTRDNSWVNYWREGPNSALDWGFGQDLANNPPSGSGPASMGQEIAATKAFAQCQVEKVYKHVCLQDPVAADSTVVDTIITQFRDDNYQMRNVFAKVAPLCMGD